jgi:hypothetical protein
VIWACSSPEDNGLDEGADSEKRDDEARESESGRDEFCRLIR